MAFRVQPEASSRAMSACQSIVMGPILTEIRKNMQGGSVTDIRYNSGVHLGTRLKRVMALRNVDVKQLARRTGKAPSTIYDILRGDHEPKDLHKFAAALGARMRYLETGKGEPLEEGTQTAVVAHSDEVHIPQLDVSASMGDGQYPPDHVDPVQVITVKLNDLRRQVSFSAPENLNIITGLGDSMEPTFKDGDILLIDTGVKAFEVDAVYVLFLNGKLYVKTIQRRPNGTFRMISDNRKYDSYDLQPEDQIAIQGRVILAWNARKL